MTPEDPLRRSTAVAASAPLSRSTLVALVLVFLVSLPAVTPRIYAADEVEFFAFLRSLWFDRDVSFQNEYQYFYDNGIARSAAFHETFLERTTETGRRVNFGTIGPAILWSPFYACADLFVRLRGGLVDGYSSPYIAAVSYGSAFYGFAAIVLSLLSVRRVFAGSTGAAARLDAAAALAILVGTPLAFYMYIAPPMSHAPSAFAVSALVLTWLVVRDRWSPSRLLVLGALTGLMAMVREQDAFFAIGPAIDYVWSLRGSAGRESRRLFTEVAAAGVAFAIVYLPQAAAYVSLNGHLGPSGIVTRKMTWSAPHAIEVLVSPKHGFLFWTPLALLAIAGLVALSLGGADRVATISSARDPHVSGTGRLAVCMVAMVALQIYVAGSVESWTVAGAFGQRRLVALTPLLVVGLAALMRLSPAGSRRLIVTGAVLISVWWNVGLMVQFGGGLMNRQRLDLPRIAYNNFVTVPRRLPELVYRYLFDRHSFYERSKE